MSYQFLDIIKSSENHNEWDKVSNLLNSYSKDPHEIVNSISQSLLHLNNYSSKIRKHISRNDKEKSLKYIKLICKLKNLIYSETSRNGVNCLELACDCFRIIIVLNDNNRNMQNDSNFWIFKQILFEYNKEKPVGCPELLKSMSDGCYDQLLTHIYELQTLYSVGQDKPEQLKAFLCLQSLEEDINKLSKCSINTTSYGSDVTSLIPAPMNVIGIVKMRSGGIPIQFVYYCPINDSDLNNDRYKITLQLMDHHEKNMLPFIPLVNLQKDINGNCVPSFVNADTLKCVSLAAKFVLKLSQPLVMSDLNIATILSITGLDLITSGMRMNYIDLLLLQNGSSLIHKDQFFAILPNDNQLIFQITNEEINIDAQTITCIPFLLPSQLPRIVAILKKQAVINSMMESFLLADLKSSFIKDVVNAQTINIFISSHDSFLISYVRQNFSSKLVKFSLSFNNCCQSSIKFLCNDIMEQDNNFLFKFQHVVSKFNNLPMAIFWILYKCGDIFIMEGLSDDRENTISIGTDHQIKDCSQLIEDNQFVDDCMKRAKNDLSISAVYHKDIFPKIKIEPKLELMTAISQPIINPFPALLHDCTNINKNKSNIVQPLMDQQNIIMLPINCQIEGNIPPILVTDCNIPNNNPVLISQTQPHKSEPVVPYSNYGSKHMSLDQMLSSDFSIPFASDTIGSLNSLSHSIHYSDHSPHSVPISLPNNNYSNHFNMMSHTKETNSKLGRMYDTQSSVLVNLLNCNENSGSNATGAFINRQVQRNMSMPSQMPDQFESPLMHTHMPRIPQIPRLRMAHPNPPKNINIPPSRPPLSAVSASPPQKSDVMMMPYPQDTGNGRAIVSRKPRKRKLSALEMNQRLPKQPMMQPPTALRQPMHHDVMHGNNSQSMHAMPHNVSNNPQHQPPLTPSSQISSNFSSPTTMDQSIYDFDDNTDCGRSRLISSTGNMQSQPNNFNNPVNRKLANAPPKKPLKVKISRKAIAQNPGSQEFKQSFNQDNDSKMKDSKLSKSCSIPVFNPNINSMRSTAIMNAIDSPLTCSSLSSMQTSPHGSVSVTCSQMSMDSNIGDPSLLKKRRKRRLKSELEDMPKKDKLEIKKQSRKKKELFLNNGNSQSGISSNSSLDTVPSMDVAIKAPLPIKLSLNAKTGSVSSNNGNSGGNGSSSSGIGSSGISAGNTNNNNNNNNRNSKIIPPLTTQPTNTNAWINQNNTIMKQSIKPDSKHQSGLIAEPLLKNYKIPKKKSSDILMSVPFQDNLKTIVHTNVNFNKSHPMTTENDLPKTIKESSIPFGKCENELFANISHIVERPKTPIMLHPDAAVSVAPAQAFVSITSVEQDCNKHNNVMELVPSNMAPSKTKHIHDIVDKLKARSGTVSTNNLANNITNNNITNNVPNNVTSAIANAISDVSPSKSTSATNNLDQNSSENIFEKFSSSKNNGKSDHRQFTNSRFPDPSCMNMLRYAYNRPSTGFTTPKPRPPIGAPITYAVPPRPPYLNNPNVYRMDSTPVRNFSPVNTQNVPPYVPKKNPNNSFANKKK